MPIISSLGALAYPKASFISFGTGRGYMFAASGASQTFNRNGNNGDTFDTNFSSVGADSSGNMYVQSCRAPTNSLLSNGTAYPIQVDDTDASPQFDFSKPVQGFGAITTTGNDTFYPQDAYVSGSGSGAIFNVYADKTAAGVGITGLDFGSSSFLAGQRLAYNAGKANLTDMMVLAFQKNTTTAITEMIVYGYNGADTGRITGPSFNFNARECVTCTNDSGVTIMACKNDYDNKYYLGRSSTTSWIFQTTDQIFDIDCDDDYVYVSHSNTGAGSSVSKVDIVTGSVISSFTYEHYGQGRYIKLADDGYLYLSNNGLSKLDTSLNMQWSKEVVFRYVPSIGTNVYAGRNGLTVRDNFAYMLGSNSTYGLFGVKIPSDGTLVSPGAWAFGTGQAYNEFNTNTPVRTTGSFTLSTPTVGVSISTATVTTTTKTAQTVSSTGVVTANQAI